MGTATTTSTLTQMMKVYYDKTLLEFALPVMVADRLADHSRDIPQKEGKTVNFTRYVALDKITSATAEGANPDYVEMEAFEFEKTVEKFTNSVRLTELLQLTSYCEPLNAAVELQGVNMGESINYQYRMAIALGFYPLRVDNSSTYAKSGSVTTATSTTIIRDTTLTEANHFWCDALLIFTSGQNKGSAHLVTAFTDTNSVITFEPALKDAPDTGDTFRIVQTKGLSATNVVEGDDIKRTVAILKNFKAPKLDGRFYGSMLSPFVEYDFMNDTEWKNANLYASPEAIKNGEVGKYGGVRFFEDTEAWTEIPTDGTEHNDDLGFGVYSATGVVNHTPVFGKHAYAGTRIAGVKDKLIIKISGDQDTSNATNAFSLVSWRAFFKAVVLNGTFGVNILSGASTVQ